MCGREKYLEVVLGQFVVDVVDAELAGSGIAVVEVCQSLLLWGESLWDVPYLDGSGERLL